MKLEPFARPSHELVGPTFQAVIIVPADSPAKTLQDLKSGEVAFGDPPPPRAHGCRAISCWRGALFQGVTIRCAFSARMTPWRSQSLTTRPPPVVCRCRSINRLLKEEKISADNPFASSQRSPAIPEYMWTFRDGLDPAFKEEIRQAFITITHPELGSFSRGDLHSLHRRRR